MSLKSFDNFCAKMVNNEPLSQKEILDERQKISRQKITLQACFLFAGLSIVNTFIMDIGLKWCEMFVLPMTWFYIISYIYWIIENFRKGSLVGIEGTRNLWRNGVVMIIICAVYSLVIFDKPFSVLENGALSKGFMVLIYLVLTIICGIISLIIVRKLKKQEQPED